MQTTKLVHIVMVAETKYVCLRINHQNGPTAAQFLTHKEDPTAYSLPMLNPIRDKLQKKIKYQKHILIYFPVTCLNYEETGITEELSSNLRAVVCVPSPNRSPGKLSSRVRRFEVSDNYFQPILKALPSLKSFCYQRNKTKIENFDFRSVGQR